MTCIDTPDADADLDGTPAGACDRDDDNGLIWATPGEVVDLVLDRGASSSTVDTFVPAAAELAFYLVRARNDCADGTGPAGTSQGI